MSRDHRRPVLRRLAAVVAAALLATVASSCSSDPQPPPAATGATTTTTTQPSTGGATSGTAPAPTGTSTGTVLPDGVTPVGAKWDWARYSSYEPYLQTLKGGYTYYEFVWCDIEPSPGTYSWSAVDRVAERTKALGMTLLIKIRVGLCWATDGEAQYARGAGKTESGMPKDLSTYADFISTAVKRYAPLGVTEFALENEVNSPSYWAGTPDQMEQLITAGAAAIRSASPQAKVVDFGLSSTTYGYGIANRLLEAGDTQAAIASWNSYYERRIGTRGDKIPRVSDEAGLKAVLGSEQGVRNLAYLALDTRLAEAKVVDVRQIHFYEKWSSVPDLMAYLEATTPAGIPIEAWEVGRFFRDDTSDEQTAAGEATQTMAGLLAAGVTVAIWLPLAVNPQGRNPDEPRYGLLDPSGSVRPSGTVMTEMAKASRGATTVVPISGPTLFGVGFEQSGSSTLFVWSKGPVSVPSGASAARAGTQPVAGTGSIDASTGPVQITTSESVASFLGSQK